jgi:hypothetical protein
MTRAMIVFSALRTALVVSFCLLFLVSGLIGCKGGGPGSQGKDPEEAHIVKVAGLIKDYEDAHNGVGPGDLDQLKDWALKEGKAQDNDFVSTRDKQPYEISVPGGKPKKGVQVSVREAKGKNGLKFMASSGSTAATEMSQGFFNYTSGETVKKSKPKSNVPGAQ